MPLHYEAATMESAIGLNKVLNSPANFTLKLVWPGFGPAAELPASSPALWRHAGCRSRRAASA
jgi:hypothetical protein